MIPRFSVVNVLEDALTDEFLAAVKMIIRKVEPDMSAIDNQHKTGFASGHKQAKRQILEEVANYLKPEQSQ